MDASYGVGVKNRYDLLVDDDDDPLDILLEAERRRNVEKSKKNVAEPAALKKDLKPKPPKQPTPKEKPQTPKSDTVGDNRTSGSRPRRDAAGDRKPKDREENRNNKEPRRQQRVTFDESVGGGGGGSSESSRRGRGRGRGRGSGLGVPRNRRGDGSASESRGKREFDRRSGSDKSSYRGPNNKRDGGGAHNWGSVRDELKNPDVELEPVENDQENSEPVESKAPETGGETETSAGAPESETEPPQADDEPKTMTLDEYKASQQKFRLKPDFNPRKVTDQDPKKWAQIPLTKDDKDTQSRPLSDSDRSHKSGRTKGAISDISVRFYEPTRRGGRGRGERGARGYGSGRRGGGGRGPSRSSAPDFGSKDDFPELEGRKGEAQKGEAQKGEAQKGEAQKGEAQKGEAQKGEAQKGEAQKGEAQKGEAQK